MDLSKANDVKTQLLVARLQVEEQRINGIAKQIADVDQQLAPVRQSMAMMTADMKRLDEARRSTNNDPDLAERIDQIKTKLATIKPQLMFYDPHPLLWFWPTFDRFPSIQETLSTDPIWRSAFLLYRSTPMPDLRALQIERGNNVQNRFLKSFGNAPPSSCEQIFLSFAR